MATDRKRRSSSPYDVGYGKPPMANRFKQGQSGNPSGRPKGRRNTFASVLAKALEGKVAIVEGGRRRMKSKLEIAITQVVNKAASGDLRALGHVLAMQPLLDHVSEEQVTPDLAADRRQAESIVARLLKNSKEEKS